MTSYIPDQYHVVNGAINVGGDSWWCNKLAEIGMREIRDVVESHIYIYDRDLDWLGEWRLKKLLMA